MVTLELTSTTSRQTVHKEHSDGVLKLTRHSQYRSHFCHRRVDCPKARQRSDTPETTCPRPRSKEGSGKPLETCGGTDGRTPDGHVPSPTWTVMSITDLYGSVCRVCPFSTLEILSARPKSISLTLKGSFWWFTNITFSSLMSECMNLCTLRKSRALAICNI